MPRAILHTLVELGANVDIGISTGQNLLATVLNDKVENGIQSYSHFRNLLEEILYARTDDKAYVDLALTIDADVEIILCKVFRTKKIVKTNEGDYLTGCFFRPDIKRFCLTFTIGPDRIWFCLIPVSDFFLQ